MTEGGAAAVVSDKPVVGSSELRLLGERIRDLERLLGRKTLDRHPPRSAGEVGVKNPTLRLVAAGRRFPIKAVADTIGVARSHLHERVHRVPKPVSPYRRPEHGELLTLVRRLVDERPTPTVLLSGNVRDFPPSAWNPSSTL